MTRRHGDAEGSRASSTPSGSSCAARCCGPSRPRAGTAPPILLIDEVDRADDEFEAFLLEVLSEWSITIPELGTFQAEVPPIVVITSNRTRDLHDALKRRCLYHWVEHPDFEREVAIVRLRAPRRVRAAGPPGRGGRRGPARRGPLQAARRGRDDRLGGGADGARALARSTSGPSTPRSAPSSSTARTRSGCAAAASPRWSRRPCSGARDDAERAGARSTAGTASFRTSSASRTSKRSPSPWPARCGASGWPPRPTPPWPTPPHWPRSGVDQRGPAYWAGRATLVHRPEDVPTYDRVFAAIFGGPAAGHGDADPEVVGARSPCCSTRRRRGRRITVTDATPVDGADDARALERSGGPAAQGLRRLHRRRARRGPPADGRPARRRRPSAVASPAGQPSLARRHRPAGHVPATRSAPGASRCAPSTVSPAIASAGSSCCATCPARWRPTPARWSASRTPRWRDAPRSRCSRSARGARGSPASSARAIPTPRCGRPRPRSTTGPVALGSATACARSTTRGA